MGLEGGGEDGGANLFWRIGWWREGWQREGSLVWARVADGACVRKRRRKEGERTAGDLAVVGYARVGEGQLNTYVSERKGAAGFDGACSLCCCDCECRWW